MMILPVWISHEDDPTKETLVYAILDNQSDTNFLLKKTANDLDLPSTDVTLLLSTMLAENQFIKSTKIKGLRVRGYKYNELIPLPAVYTREVMPASRDHIPTPEMTQKWPHLRKLYNEIPPKLDVDIALLLGVKVRKVLEPIDVVRSSTSKGPFGQRSVLGWGIVGIVDEISETDPIGVSHRIFTPPTADTANTKADISPRSQIVLRTKVKEVTADEVLSALHADFHESSDIYPQKISQDDKRFLEILQNGITKVNGHYQMPLPFKDRHPQLSTNRSMALKRLEQLKRRLKNNKSFKMHYNTFMSELFEKGYAEPAKPIDSGKPVSYIPHHGVYNINKPGQVRVVFDCSAKTAGAASLNDCLLQGPDLTNSLMGVLCRFRLGPIALVCDIKKMFYQFRVNEEHRDYLRFFWWPNGHLDTEPREYRMTVHLFGASSSPGCSNFALKQTAIDNSEMYGTSAAKFLHDDFYVDDGLKSCESEKEAIALVKNSVAMCAAGGLRLHKFVSNSEEVLHTIPEEDKAVKRDHHDILSSSSSIERALGILWCIRSDTFKYKITLKERPPTRRGILSTVSSIFDPLGFLAPFILTGKNILQTLCQNNYDWDEEVPQDILERWSKWKEDAVNLDQFELPRCVKPTKFGKTVKSELHHFADASSSSGYGTCTYLRQINENGRVHVALIMGKSRVIPLKKVTVPRLELTAAVVAVNISRFLTRELKLDNLKSYYWTDSKVVLGYIGNSARRFHVYVANRIEQIRSYSEPHQWKHVDGNKNPADIASRGMSAAELVKSRLWYSGPDFLWKQTLPTPLEEVFPLPDDDPEVKKSTAYSTKAEESFDVHRFNHVSDWFRLKRAIALCLKLKDYLLMRVRARRIGNIVKERIPLVNSITAEDLTKAESEIVRHVQRHAFGRIKPGEKISKRSPLFRLDVYVDEQNIVRVGGRLTRSCLAYEVRHPAVLPKSSHVTQLVLRHFHERCHHQGKGITLNALRTSGFWIINVSSLVGRTIHQCVICRKVRSSTRVQKMADLPEDRCHEAPPFSYSAMDFFGPFYVKEGRKTLKRYGCIFTCLASRAVHIEVTHALSTDSFINALRRFMSIRGPVKMLRSDRGTNFIGAKNELEDCLATVTSPTLKKFLLQHDCDIQFVFNPPHASHFGGVYERMIRSTRNILNVLLEQHSAQLDDESLRTFMCEVAAIINSRPLTTDTLNDPQSIEPLTPNHLLMAKSSVILPPPGEFVKQDVYLRKRWRRVQYLLDQFWTRWKAEYLNNLQTRSKWNKPQKNLAVEDIVLVKDPDLPRNDWRLARVIETKCSKDGFVRSAKVVLSDPTLDKRGRRVNAQTELERPISKLVLVLEGESETEASPPENQL